MGREARSEGLDQAEEVLQGRAHVVTELILPDLLDIPLPLEVVDQAVQHRVNDEPVPRHVHSRHEHQEHERRGLRYHVVEQHLAIGNCVYARLGDSPPPPCKGTKQGDIVIFDPQDAKGDEQKVLNIFYFNCYMHDYFYLLGFREVMETFRLIISAEVEVKTIE